MILPQSDHPANSPHPFSLLIRSSRKSAHPFSCLIRSSRKSAHPLSPHRRRKEAVGAELVAGDRLACVNVIR